MRVNSTPVPLTREELHTTREGPLVHVQSDAVSTTAQKMSLTPSLPGGCRLCPIEAQALQFLNTLAERHGPGSSRALYHLEQAMLERGRKATLH